MSKKEAVWDCYRCLEILMQGGIAVRRRATTKFWAFMIVMTVMVFGLSFAVMQHRYAQGEFQLQQVRAYRDQLTLEVQDLNDQLAYAQTDDFIMRAARDQLGMIMPGEVRYVNGAK